LRTYKSAAAKPATTMAVATTAFLVRVVVDHLLASTVACYVEVRVWSLTTLPRLLPETKTGHRPP